MKQIELFYLKSCPYCRNAKKAIDELTAENPAYEAIDITWIEESEQPEIAEQRDYFRVPTVFWNGEKLYEARPSHSYADVRDHLREAFDLVLHG